MLKSSEGTATPNRHWFALRTKPRHEKAAAVQLEAMGLGTYVPAHLSRRRWSDRWVTKEIPLFEGYIFCKFGVHEIGPVRAARGVLYVLPVGEPPAPVSATELQYLKRVVQECGDVSPVDRLEPGDQVEVIEGPLEGVCGTLMRRNGQTRLVVTIGLLGRGVETEIHIDQVRLLADRLGVPEPRSRPLRSRAT